MFTSQKSHCFGYWLPHTNRVHKHRHLQIMCMSRQIFTVALDKHSLIWQHTHTHTCNSTQTQSLHTGWLWLSHNRWWGYCPRPACVQWLWQQAWVSVHLARPKATDVNLTPTHDTQHSNWFVNPATGAVQAVNNRANCHIFLFVLVPDLRTLCSLTTYIAMTANNTTGCFPDQICNLHVI